VLPLVEYCNPKSAETISSSMKFGLYDAGTYPDFASVKLAFEKTYACLGMTCSQVGSLVGADTPSCAEHPPAPAFIPSILSFSPGSLVTDHARIDLDQIALEAAFTSEYLFDDVKAVYEKGAHSKPVATCTFTGSTPNEDVASKQSVLMFTTNAGDHVSAKTSSSYTANDPTISFSYSTSGERKESESTACHVGGLTSTAAAYSTQGCIDESQYLFVNGDAYEVTCDSTQAGRTLAGFSTKAKKLMYDPSMGSCPRSTVDPTPSYTYGCPYSSFAPYFEYYCADESSACFENGDYANQIILAGLGKTATALTNGNMDFSATATFHSGSSGVANSAIKEVVKKATAYMSTWMYAIREFEDAIDDCTGADLTNNDLSSGSPHAWDEGVAFYVGSYMERGMLTGAYTNPDGSGYLLEDLSSQGALSYTLANKRCQNFKTCGPRGNSMIGEAKVNMDLWPLFSAGQYSLIAGRCADVVPVKKAIVQKMTVPLIQGTLRYAWLLGVESGDEADRGEGAVFAAAVLPQLHACNPSVATTVYEHMKLNSADSPDFTAVKVALESCYTAMGITCEEVGGYVDGDGSYKSVGGHDSSPCVTTVGDSMDGDGSGSVGPDETGGVAESKLDNGAIAGIVIACLVAVLFITIAVVMVVKEKQGAPIFQPVGGGIPAISTTTSKETTSYSVSVASASAEDKV